MLEIKPIDLNNSSEKKAFVKFAWECYKGDNNWVPPLYMDINAKLDMKKHPFFEYGKMQAFMAYRDGKPVGRIAAVENPPYNDYHKSSLGFWGFFECFNDQEVANALFDTAAAWCKKFGHDAMVGPASPSSNYDYGMLVEGFNDAPRVMMTYNPAYYVDLVNNYGMTKFIGLLAYQLVKKDAMNNEKFMRVQKAARERSKITVRYLDKNNIKKELPIIKEIYNKAWENNAGFVPMTDRELDAMGEELKMVVEPKLFPILENEHGKPVGLAMSLPDYNEIIKGFNGNLFPFNFLKLFTQKSKLYWVRVVLAGVIPEYRNKGLDAVLYYEMIKSAMDMSFTMAEASWILEDNPAMNRGMEVVGGEVYKRYVVYTVPIK